ncbi:NAD(P)/FAD-dependent oxidoreductase [Amycolatopsis pithecellobii]|uniref:Pyridine nucleotide-disulfide oxidoreductase n=1 Tax=Amycolatopsis pithecellobii TaxID=664692 RepID=A0A6N7YUR7_9PSEU|nr:FAD-dependent oxidoreductase [Amycolatopsis pithecellobii]MTD55682.1 pyridine nucleotide-disulfide oxidoreductase [Amycolatopsis pithecellobii]
MAEPSFVIVGAGLAGLRAAETVRAEGFAGRVVLIGDEPHLPYDRPPLSKGVLDGSRSPDSTRLRDESFYVDNDIDVVVGRRVAALRPHEGTVELADGTIVAATKVLLATGGRPRTLAVRGADLPGVRLLRTLDDAVAVASELDPGAAVVVIGAGFIGAEVAASARTIGCEVTMLEAAPIPLGRALGPDIAERYGAHHRARGVNLRCAIGVDAIEGTRRVQAVTTTDGVRYPAEVVVVGIGIVPNTELADAAGITLGNGIVVDETCRTSNPAVFAAGDVADFHSTVVDRRVRRESWQNALDQGAAAAMSMLGKGSRYCETPWFWTDQYDLKLQMAGTPEPTDDVVWRGDPDSGEFCAFYLRDGILTGAVGINRPKDVRAALALIMAHKAVPAELLADPSIDLRKATR